MTFRDDHDAALARGDALARELDRSKEETEVAEQKLAEANAERARLEAEVETLRKSAPAPKPPPRPAPPAKDRSAAYFAVCVIFLILIIGVAMALISGEQKKERATKPKPVVYEPTSCALTTDPTGAEIWEVTGSRPSDVRYLGKTPFEKTREDWITDAALGKQYRLKLPGYATLEVAAPVRGARCEAGPFNLVRQ